MLWLLFGAGVAWLLGNRIGTSQASARKSLPVTYTQTIESWRPLAKMATDIPTEAIMAWISEESNGNPCAIGDPPDPKSGARYPQEYGLFQLNAQDPENLKIATPAYLRDDYCAVGPNWHIQTRGLSETEKAIQMTAGVNLLRLCRDHARSQLAKAGVVWDENGPDFWNLVKMWHASPGLMAMLTSGTKSWADYRSKTDSASMPILTARFEKQKPGKGAILARSFLNRVWNNCEAIGRAVASENAKANS